MPSGTAIDRRASARARSPQQRMALVFAPVLFLLAACGATVTEPQAPPQDEPVEEPMRPLPVPVPPASVGAFSLRGDPGFDVGGLSDAQRVWHERS